MPQKDPTIKYAILYYVYFNFIIYVNYYFVALFIIFFLRFSRHFHSIVLCRKCFIFHFVSHSVGLLSIIIYSFYRIFFLCFGWNLNRSKHGARMTCFLSKRFDTTDCEIQCLSLITFLPNQI